MQDKQFEALVNDALSQHEEAPSFTKQKMESIAMENVKALAEIPITDKYRTPTAEEFMTMREWTILYKKEHKRASKRQVRKAVQEHFNIIIYK